MGQEEVRLVLSKNKNWLLAREISKCLDLSMGTIFRCLASLHKNGEIEKETAIKVIKDDARLKSIQRYKHIFAYKIRDKQEDLDESFDKVERKNISNIISDRLRKLPTRKI